MYPASETMSAHAKIETVNASLSLQMLCAWSCRIVWLPHGLVVFCLLGTSGHVLGKQRSSPDLNAPQNGFMTAMYRHVWHPYPNAWSISKFVKLIHLGVSAEGAIENISKSALSISCEEIQCIDHVQDSVVKNTMRPMTRTARTQRRDKNYPPKPTKLFHFIGGRTSPVSAPIRARSHYYTVSLSLPQVHSSWTDSSPRKSDQHQHLLWYVHLGNSLHLRVKEPSIWSCKCWRPGNCKTDNKVSILLKCTT